MIHLSEIKCLVHSDKHCSHTKSMSSRYLLNKGLVVRLLFSTRKLELSLQKLAYSNILKISQPYSESFQIKKKNSDIFYISAQNVDCGYSLESPRYVF